jgi:hypothetical protein
MRKYQKRIDEITRKYSTTNSGLSSVSVSSGSREKKKSV